MSSISKLQITGIRAFSPEQAETIEFYSPLTMIVGANGCGKTSVIESLKFVCTGALPPNTKSGQSLVNDPAMTDSSAVKASIKLKFQNQNDENCLASRTLQVTQKKGKLEYKALDNTLKITGKNGEKESLSLKGAEMDRTMCESLGVSAAIVENVMFVHQEDSNWPMMEGIVLKKKFDDVFESTRYTRAIEAFTKTKKEYQSKSKDIRAELMEFGAHLVTAQNYEKDYENAKESKENCESQLDDLQGMLESNEKKIKDCGDSLNKAKANMNDLQQLQWQLEEEKRRFQDKESNLERKLPEDNERLQTMLQNFENIFQQKKSEFETIQEEEQNIQGFLQNDRELQSEIKVKVGKGNMLKEQYDQFQKQLNEFYQELNEKYKSQFSFSGSQDFVKFLDNEMRVMKKEAQFKISDARAAYESQEADFNDARGRLQQVDVELRLKNDECSDVIRESEMKRAEALKLSSNKMAIQTLQFEFEEAQKNNESFMTFYQNKSNELKKNIKEATEEIRDLQEKISEGSQVLQELGLRRSELVAVEAQVKQTQLEGKQLMSEACGILKQHRDISEHMSTAQLTPDGISQPQVELSVEKVRQRIHQVQLQQQAESEKNGKAKQRRGAQVALRAQQEDILMNLGVELAELESQFHKQQQELNSNSKFGNVEEYLKILFKKLNDLRAHKVFCSSGWEELVLPDMPSANASQNTNKENEIKELGDKWKEAAENLQNEAKITEEESRDLLTVIKSGKAFLRRFKKSPKRKNGDCPCCGQKMSSADVVAEYEKNVKALLTYAEGGAECTVDEHTEVVKECVEISEQIKSFLITINTKYSLLQRKISAEIQLKELNASENELKNEENLTEKSLQEFSALFNNLNSVERNLSEILRRWKLNEIKENEFLSKKKNLIDQVGVFGVEFNGKSLEEIEQEMREKVEKKDEIQNKKDRWLTDENNLTKKSYHLSNILAEKEKMVKNAEIENNRLTELENSINQLHHRLEEIETRKVVLSREKDEIDREVEEKQHIVQTQKSFLQQLENEQQQRIESITSDISTMTQLKERTESTKNTLDSLDLGNSENELSKISREIIENEQKLIKTQETIKILSDELSSQDRTRKNILGNLELREMEITISEMEGKLAEKMGNSSKSLKNVLNSIEKDYALLLKEKGNLTSQYDKLKGNKEIHEQQMRDYSNKLKQPTYKGIEEKHRRKNIEFETTNLAVTDLENYCSALDKALQNFHTLKIREINKIIRELWQLIYKGQDIDMIELESDSMLEDMEMVSNSSNTGKKAAAPKATTKGSKSYNYRVVMKKGDTPLDMRGRCSAGQKVLASLVIRLALAETFCVNCGILALDEPTTNLDEENKKGLAHALAKIIIGRAVQQNFQLICITHDEDFVRIMSNELSSTADFDIPEHYFRVYREEKGTSGKFFSHIERLSWDDM